ncbi:proteasome regulatory particle base subunit [Coemansia sp. RSA 1813]|nr:proteasome regulatory particle base subunit [Coemansia sp. RSA 1646]KAJ1765059.1 proteasome regulatory particle base subunit [Coemansia sp. RSA 1843]KAJ2085157.1 proteasome regulatory particle base subunit [Coemansia sp. RSA 986]KAJ2215010.1 proteasome regulatory particle base subunit [Coemansia sp. RSA 487]KAJ2562001.1 proteasome regulatory particle base subunit [Coemansia sp. RSA 1813]
MAVQVDTLTSANGLISLLDEDERELQYYGLTQLNSVTDRFWAEISDSISKIEILYEDESFQHRKLAALVASKIYFHLGEFDDALTFALGADDLFNLAETSAYVQTVINHAIDKYIELRSLSAEDKVSPVDARLEAVVERMFARCFETKDYGQVVGISIEARRLDVLERALTSGDTRSLLEYVQKDCVALINSIHVQAQVQELLVKVHLQFDSPDYEAVCLCLSKLNNPQKTAEILKLLVKDGESDVAKLLSAYQIAFDLEANATQEFTRAVIAEISPSNEAAEADEKDDVTPTARIKSILSGDETLKLHLEFLFRNNKTDMKILDRTCKVLDSRLSLSHNAVTFANAFMHAGTTVDNFLRDNLEWLSRASSWSKFTATAALGVIHHGQVKHGMTLLQPYLPEDNTSTSPFSEGGAFFALGLIHACHGSDKVLKYLQDALVTYQGQNVEILHHGACLGLGAAGMGSGSEEIAQALMNVLYSDSAVSGEAAAIGLGLVMMGTKHESALNDMLQYAKETEHEKIIRALSVGMGLVMFGRKQEADGFVARLIEEEDPLLRLGAVHAITMAYCGTGDNSAIRKLLHLAVSDVKDDVRRAAVTGLGFILLRSPEQVPRMVQLLSQSYNPHVRVGAAVALGIACAGTGSKAAVEILEPMLKDSVDFVVEGASIALAFILIQQNDTFEPKVADVKKRYCEILDNKHGEGVSRFGAAISQGIIDAGGRNVTIGLTTSDKQLNAPACAGMLLFLQFWYWFPLAHFLTLSFKPTALIAINKDLKAPNIEVTCASRKALYSYPPEIEQIVSQAPTKVATAVLSTTARARRTARKSTDETETDAGVEKKSTGDDGEKMETDNNAKEQADEGSMDVDEDNGSGADPKSQKKSRKPANETSFTVTNLARVLPYQEKYVKWSANSRYVPVKQGRASGVLLVKDTTPDAPEDLIVSMLQEGPDDDEESAADADADELQPPEPFEYPFDSDRA